MEYCAECGSSIRSQLAWRAELDNFLVEDLTPKQLSELIDCLDEAVEIICTDFGIGK